MMSSTPAQPARPEQDGERTPPQRLQYAGAKPCERLAGREVEASIAVAGYNCKDYLEQAVASALHQDVSLEVIIVDDASTDGTADLAHRLAANDARVKVIELPVNLGPAGARNAALDAARGRWFCILDADDLLHPDRLKTLIAHAEAEDADLIADDLIVFDDLNAKRPTRFLQHHAPGTSEWMTLSKYLRSTRMLSNKPNLGYLKPIIRLSRLRHAGIRYSEQLRIGEDDHFVLSMLLAGFRYRILALPSYYYRKHSSSISHRLSRETIAQIELVAKELEPSLKLRSADEKKAFAARLRSVTQSAAFVNLVRHVQAREWRKALRHIVCNPGTIPLLRQPPADKLRRWARKLLQRPIADDHVLIVSGASQAQMADRAAEHVRLTGGTPAHLVLDDQPTSPVRSFFRLSGTSETHIPSAYFRPQANGEIIVRTRLSILQLARQAKSTVFVDPLPRLLAREFIHLSTSVSTFSYEPQPSSCVQSSTDVQDPQPAGAAKHRG